MDYWGGIDGAVRGMSTLPSFLDAMLLKTSSRTLLAWCLAHRKYKIYVNRLTF